MAVRHSCVSGGNPRNYRSITVSIVYRRLTNMIYELYSVDFDGISIASPSPVHPCSTADRAECPPFMVNKPCMIAFRPHWNKTLIEKIRIPPQTRNITRRVWGPLIISRANRRSTRDCKSILLAPWRCCRFFYHIIMGSLSSHDPTVKLFAMIYTCIRLFTLDL